MSKTSKIIESIKDAIRWVTTDEQRLDLLAIDDKGWWLQAVSSRRDYLKYLHSSPEKGRTLLKYIVDRSSLVDVDRRNIISKYLQRTKQCKLLYERLVIMKSVLLRYRKKEKTITCEDDATSRLRLKDVYTKIMNNHLQQQQQRVRLDTTRCCFISKHHLRAYGKMTLICTGDGYSVHLSEDRKASIVLCDTESIDLKHLFIPAKLCGGEHVPRVLSEHLLPNVLTTCLLNERRSDDDDDDDNRVITASLTITEPIISSLSSFLRNRDEQIDTKTAALRTAFTITEKMASWNVQHGALSTRNILQSNSGWFIIDRRTLQIAKETYTQYLHDQPCLYVKSWDTYCLYIDSHEQLKYDCVHRKLVVGPLYPLVKLFNGNAKFTPRAKNADETLLEFTIDVGNSNVILETLTATIDTFASEVDMSWSRDLCVKTVINGSYCYIPREIFLDKDIEIGEKLGCGTNSYVYNVIASNNIAKLTENENDIERRLQDLAYAYGYAPKINAYFSIGRYAGVSSADRVIDNIACIVMEQCDATLRETITCAIKRHSVQDLTDIQSTLSQAFRLVRDFAKTGFMHRDLRCDNIMIKNGYPTIIDFGMARHTTIHNSIHNPNYIPNPDVEAAKDLTVNDLSWIGIPALCLSYIYDLLSLYIDVCLLINMYWRLSNTDEGEPRRQFLAQLRQFMISDILEILQSASCNQFDAYFDQVQVNEPKTDAYLSVTFVYVEKVKKRIYQTVIDTSLINFLNKRQRTQ